MHFPNHLPTTLIFLTHLPSLSLVMEDISEYTSDTSSFTDSSGTEQKAISGYDGHSRCLMAIARADPFPGFRDNLVTGHCDMSG